jgi:hypothetical protein
MTENRQEDLLVVGTASILFDKVNMTVLWAMRAEMF